MLPRDTCHMTIDGILRSHLRLKITVYNILSVMRAAPFCQDCHHEHNEICKFCSDTYSVIDDLEQLIVDGLYPTDEIRSEFIHDFQNYKERIFLWRQHILRTVNQEAAKTFIL